MNGDQTYLSLHHWHCIQSWWYGGRRHGWIRWRTRSIVWLGKHAFHVHGANGWCNEPFIFLKVFCEDIFVFVVHIMVDAKKTVRQLIYVTVCIYTHLILHQQNKAYIHMNWYRMSWIDSSDLEEIVLCSVYCGSWYAPAQSYERDPG